MSITVQNLRAVNPGVQPASLLEGQIAFNITDRVLFVGDGSNFKTEFDGTQVATTPGEGWYAMPMDFAGLDNFFVPNPAYWGDTPTNEQVLSWDAAAGHPVWSTTGQDVSVNYITTNALVDAAPGSDTSTKISAALGVTPAESDSVIVQGDPGDAYQGFYQFISGFWVFSAQNAFPTAAQVPVDESVFPLGSTVQLALENLSTLVTAAQATADAALPKAGGTMTGFINFANGQPVDAGSF
jgi:hypothetical protein